MFKKENIVISIGDDGAILTRFNAGKLVKRAFAPSSYSSEFKEFVKDFETIPVTILLDSVDQNYVFSSLPSTISKSNQLKIIKRKLQNEFDQNDLNSFINQGKEDPKGKKGVKYVFISVRKASPLSDWLEAIQELANPFSGIYLLPLEGQNLLTDFTKKGKKVRRNNEEIEKWQIIISHNRVGGFRQVVYKNGKIIFTRISQNPGLQSPDAIATNITQESANTLEYIRRIGYTDQPLEFYVIALKDAHKFIEIPGINSKNITCFSPYELSEILALKDAALETDKFADVVIASHFINSKKKILRLTTDEAKKSQSLLMAEKATTAILFLLMLILPIITLTQLYSGYQSSSKISDLETKKRSLSTKLSTIKDFETEYGKKPDFVVDLVKTNKNIQLQEDKISEFITKYNNFDVYTKELLDFNFSRDKNNGKVTIIIDVVFENANLDNIKELLSKMAEYQNKIKEEFENYNITVEGIPEEKDLSNRILLDSKSPAKASRNTRSDNWNKGIAVKVTFITK